MIAKYKSMKVLKFFHESKYVSIKDHINILTVNIRDGEMLKWIKNLSKDESKIETWYDMPFGSKEETSFSDYDKFTEDAIIEQKMRETEEEFKKLNFIKDFEEKCISCDDQALENMFIEANNNKDVIALDVINAEMTKRLKVNNRCDYDTYMVSEVDYDYEEEVDYGTIDE